MATFKELQHEYDTIVMWALSPVSRAIPCSVPHNSHTPRLRATTGAVLAGTLERHPKRGRGLAAFR
jgi:hypothetical protein